MRILDDRAKEIIGEIPKLARIAGELADLYQREPRSILPVEAIGGTILAQYDRPGKTRKGQRVSVDTILPNDPAQRRAEFRDGTACDFSDLEWDSFTADCEQPLRVEEQRKVEAQR